jgi:hypothetical protein
MAMTSKEVERISSRTVVAKRVADRASLRIWSPKWVLRDSRRCVVAFVLMVELTVEVDAADEASEAIDGWADRVREFGGDDDGGEWMVGEDMPWMDVQPEMTKTSADQRTMASASF